MLRNFGVAAHSAGATHLKGLPRVDDQIFSPTAKRPYRVVEFDGHRLNIRLKVVIPDPLGFSTSLRSKGSGCWSSLTYVPERCSDITLF